MPIIHCGQIFMSRDFDDLLEALSYDELLALNELIVERLKFLDRQETHEAMMQFHPGARVSFESSKHGLLQGTLMKFNQKTVTVLTDDGRKWKVAPQLLSLLKKKLAPPMNVVDIRKEKFDPSRM